MASPQAGQVTRSVSDFGAKGDGRSDDTEAFRLALATGDCVLVPPCANGYRITRTLALQRPGQRVIGFGEMSRIFLDPTDDAQANLLVTRHEDTFFSGLHLVPGDVRKGLFEGWAIAVSETRRVGIQDCMFSGMRRGGVLIVDSHDCHVRDSVFVASVVRGDGSERQGMTGYDILMAGTASRNMVTGNQCLSGVGVGVACQTVTPGKRQAGNIIRNNIIRNQPCYGIMVYLSDTHDRLDPDGKVDEITIDGNDISDISGSILVENKTIFYGCGIYLQASNDIIVTGNRIVRTNTARQFAFSSSAVPAAIGISGYGNAVVSANVIDTCYHGIASLQTTARPRRGDGTIIADNLIRNCEGIGLWLGDGVAATVHDNRLTAKSGKGTHGVLVRRLDSDWMDGFLIRGNEITDFAVGVEVSGDKVPRADISSNHIRGSVGNAIYSSAAISMIHHNYIEGRFGISLAPAAKHGLCQDNLISTSALAIIDDGGSGIRVENNIVPAGTAFSTSVAQTLSPGSEPAVFGKRWFRKLESSPIVALAGGYEGQEISIVAEAPFLIRPGAALRLRGTSDVRIEKGGLITLVLIGGVWRQVD